MSNSAATALGAGLAFLTAWTVGVHAVTLGALPFDALYAVLTISIAAAIAGARAGKTIAPIFDPDRNALPLIVLHWPALGTVGWAHLALSALLATAFAVAAGLQYFKSTFTPLMLVCGATAGLAVIASWRSRGLDFVKIRAAAPAQVEPIPAGTGFLLLAATVLAFYALTSVPDTDDAFFLNMAVGAIRDRGAVMAHDTMLGVPGLDMMRSSYRLETYTLLAATIADLTGIRVITSAHAVVPAMLCIFAASILAILHRALFGRAWLVTALMHLALLVAMDGSLASYGYHAIPRFIHGKGPFVTVMVPLIAFLAIQATRVGTWRALGLLAAAITASIGMTANAVYAGPLTAALAAAPLFAAGTGAQRMASLRLILAILYPAALAVYLLIFDPPTASEFEGIAPIGEMLWAQFGANYVLALSMSVLFAAAAAAALGRGMTLISLYVLGLIVLALNPVAWQFYGTHVTGNINVRLFWAVPIPFILAILCGLAWRSLPRSAALAVPAATIVLTAGPGSILHKTAISPALVKVHQPAYDIAAEINTAAPETGLILAPEALSAWLTTFDDAHPVVEGRWLYLPTRAGMLPAAEHNARDRLFRWVDGHHGLEMSLDEAMPLADTIGVSVIAVRDGTQAHEAMTTGATVHGFEPRLTPPGYTVFLRSSRP